MLDWHTLEVFVTAARLQNFSAAATELNLSQPAVTQRIRTLEAYLHVTLFERQRQRVFLSEAGAFLLPLAEDLLRRSKRLEEMMHSLSGQVVGHLVIGCSTTSGKYILPGLLARFCQRYPGVSATVQVGSRARVLEMLLARGVHLAFSSERVEHAEIAFTRFLEDDVVLVASSHHPWAQRSAIAAAELLNEHMIMREKGSGTYNAVVQALEGVDISLHELHTVMTLGNSEAILMAVEEGIGVGFVPQSAAARFLSAGQICRVPIEGVRMQHTIWMAENTLQPATSAQIHFQKMLEAAGLDRGHLYPAALRDLWQQQAPAGPVA